LKDAAKTKKQLVAELEELRQQRAVGQAAERLREHVLAMRSSEDLYSVGAAFLGEVRRLEIDTLFLGILLFEGEKIVHHYPVTVSYAHMGLQLRNENDPAIKKVTNEAVIRDIPPDQMPEPWKVEAYRAFQTKSVTKVRNYLDDRWLRSAWTGTESNLNRAIEHWTGEWIRIHIPFSRGAIAFNSRTDDEQQVKTVASLAEVFSLGYIRFLDFERLEQQSHQARLEATVQRVRAEATAMQQSRDVIQVMIALWQGLEEMIPPFEWCSLNIQDQEADVLRSYAAIKPIDAVTLAHFSTDKVIRENIVAGVHLLSAEVPLSFAHERGYATQESEARIHRLSDTTYQRLNQYWGAQLAPGTYAGHAALNVPFGYGGIFVMGTETADFDREELTIVEAFADAVTLGYTRFLDLQKLEQASQNKSQFLRRMSHDLRSPMNAIIGYSRLLQRRLADRMDEREARNLANIQISSSNLLNLINDILDLSRIEAGRIEVNVQSVDVRTLAGECADALESIVQEGVVLRRDLEDIGKIQSDPDRLRQVVMNLLGNATKFTGEGSISLSLHRVDGAVELAVADTGVGIPPEDLPHIFDEFRQVERQGGEQTEGTGLGLAIAKKTVELLGGTITAESAVGKGTTFTLRIMDYEAK